jgi:hypothetical protein
MSTTFKYGLLAAFGFIAYELIAWQTGLNSHNISLGYGLGYLTILIPIAVLYLALKERKTAQEGWLALREGIGTSFRVGLVMMVFTTFFMSIYITQIQPDYSEVRVEHERSMYFDSLKKQNANWTDDHARDIAIAQFPDTNQSRMLVSYALLKISTALLVGLVLTFFLRKEKPPQPQRTDSNGTPISSSK